MRTVKHLFLMMVVLAMSSQLFISCGDDNTPNPMPTPLAADELLGNITADRTLDSAMKYKLLGALIVKNGATLTIPAGTVITATEKTAGEKEVRYIAVEQGGKIDVQGTEEHPVVMTSTKKTIGGWGGLVICGKAPQNKAGKAGGISASEVAELSYGGTDIMDNSGSLKYLRLEYTGFKYSDTKEFNGVSFFGVGAGTTVDYVSSYMSDDDGIEFFGGTVNAKHLVSIGSADDGIDFADGWNGTGDSWYVKDSKASGIEGSNNGDNGASNVPMTNATLKNLTIYGMNEKPWYFKEGAGKQNIDNVVIGGLSADSSAYFYADSKDPIAIATVTNSNDIKINNVKFVDMGAENKPAIEGVVVNESATATGAGSNGKELPMWAAKWAVAN